MRHHEETTGTRAVPVRRRAVRAGPTPMAGLALGLALGLAALTGGCSTAARDTTARPTASSAPVVPAPSVRPSPTTTAVPSGTPSTTPGRRPSPRPQLSARPVPELVGIARPRQVQGLVRIVAAIGTGGRAETSTGMVLTGDGEVLTNNHGVTGAASIRVTVQSTGRSYPARLTAADPGRDVALLQLVGAAGLDTVTLAARDPRVGQVVTVVGDAGGLRSTFTAATGAVVARGQTLVAPATGTARAERLTGLVLSTTNVSLGESGGPTYDARGRVVGMTTASVRLRDGSYGVAVPVRTLRTAVAAVRR